MDLPKPRSPLTLNTVRQPFGIRIPGHVSCGLCILATVNAFFAASLPAQAADPKPQPSAQKESETSQSSGVASDLVRFVKEAVGVFSPTNEVITLFNGRDLSHFYTWVKDLGTYVDPDPVFSVKDGLLHITGKRLGYLATQHQYSDYRLVVEYKWGELTFAPRVSHPRNSGVFVHATGLDKIWMKGLECQIAEGNTGDVVLHDGAKLTVNGETQSKPWSEFHRSPTNEVEFVHGKWNVMEIVCEGGRVQVKVNGHITLDGVSSAPNYGKILFQSNGAEIFFRRIELFPIKYDKSKAPPAKKPETK